RRRRPRRRCGVAHAAVRDRDREPAHARARPGVRTRRRGDRDVRPRDSHLAHARRRLRPPLDRSLDRAPRVDRLDPGHGDRSVGIGLVMSAKLMRRRGLGPKLLALHEQTSLAGLIAIGVHGVTLLGDPWLHPGLAGISVPFAMGYRTFFTGLGIIGAWLAALL